MAGVADTFRGLPMEDLIAAPLKAVCDSQKQLAKSTHEFMTQIGFDTDDKGNLSGPRLLEYQLERPVNDGTMAKVVVKAPLLTLVPIPALAVNEVNIDFQMEVTDTQTTTSKTASEITTEASGSAGFLFWRASVKMNGKVSSSRENTRTTNQTAKYQIRVNARQQQPTEGLSKLMDIMASCIEPIEAATKKE